jgi:TPR repeat protein
MTNVESFTPTTMKKLIITTLTALTLLLPSTSNSQPPAQKEISEWQIAAERGDAEAQCNIGKLYENGDTVSKDQTEALKWYRRSAEQGNAVAQFRIGLMYSKGHGVRKDYAEAARWYRKAAEQGHADAQFNLGRMYSTGQGVRQNNRSAKEWYGKACDNGLQKGCDEYRELNEQGY